MTRERALHYLYLLLWLVLAMLPAVYAIISDDGYETVRYCLEGLLGGPLPGM